MHVYLWRLALSTLGKRTLNTKSFNSGAEVKYRYPRSRYIPHRLWSLPFLVKDRGYVAEQRRFNMEKFHFHDEAKR